MGRQVVGEREELVGGDAGELVDTELDETVCLCGRGRQSSTPSAGDEACPNVDERAVIPCVVRG